MSNSHKHRNWHSDHESDVRKLKREIDALTRDLRSAVGRLNAVVARR